MSGYALADAKPARPVDVIVTAARLSCEHRLEIVPGATHLFEEPGTLDRVARLARDWFLKHLQA